MPERLNLYNLVKSQLRGDVNGVCKLQRGTLNFGKILAQELIYTQAR